MGKIAQPTHSESSPSVQGTTDRTSAGISTEAEMVWVGDSPPDNLTNEAVKLISLKSRLGIDATDSQADLHLKSIIEWARENGIKNRNQLVSKIREIQYKLGTQDTQAESIKKVYEYVRLNSQIKSLVNKQELLRAS